MDPIQRDEGMKAMHVGQLLAGVGIGIGLAAGSIGGWKMVQQRQAIAVSPNAAGSATSAALLVSDPVSNSEPNLAPNQPPATVIMMSQAENDYLYDLSQSLQSVEQRRIKDSEKLAIGRQIAGWLQAGADYWAIRTQFDQAYGTAIAGNYAHNREIYIKFATERFAPAFVATLAPPPEVITRTEYVEVPGPTQYVEVPSEPEVIETIVTVPKPYPIPVYPPHHHPQPRPWPPHPHPQPSPEPQPDPSNDLEPPAPDQPDQSQNEQPPTTPPTTEVSQPQPDADDRPNFPAELEQANQPPSIEVGVEPQPTESSEAVY